MDTFGERLIAAAKAARVATSEIRSTPVAPAAMEMIDEESAAETSPRKIEEGPQEL
jgi:hypothetical protein